MDLKTRAIKSAAWYASSRLWGQSLSWVVSIILARLLTPGDYGLFAMALTVLAFFELFQEFGLGVAIIQRQDLTKQQLNGFFWIISTVSVAATLAAFFSAGVAAWFYEEPRLLWMVRALCLVFLLNSLGMVPHNLLTKEIDFRRRSVAEASGVALGAGVSVSFAYFGYGVWALVAGQLVTAAVRNSAMVVFCGWIPGLEVSFAGLRSVLKFSLHVAGTSIVKTISDMANIAILGRLLGGSAVGLYTMADSLGRSPLHRLSTSVINQLSLPVFAKLQRDEEQLRRYFLRVTKYLAVITFPAQFGMALVASDMVLVLLSAKWAAIAPLVQAFCVGGVCYVMSLPSTALMTARGKANKVFRAYWVGAAMLAGGVAAGTRFGLTGVAVGWLITFPPLRLYLLWLSLMEVEIGVRRYLAAISSSLLATAAMGIVVWSVGDRALAEAGALQRLGVEVAVGAATYVLALLLIDRGLGEELKGIFQTLLATSRA